MSFVVILKKALQNMLNFLTSLQLNLNFIYIHNYIIGMYNNNIQLCLCYEFVG